MNFQRLFTDYYIPCDTGINKGWINTHCPFCGGQKMYLGFNQSSDYCNCWRCGSLPLYETVSLIIGIPKKDIYKVLDEYKDTNLITQSLNKKTAKALQIELPSNDLTEKERKYLIKRNYDPDYLINKYKLCSGGIFDIYKYRIIIPFYFNNKLVSWTARSILSNKQLDDVKKPRYLNLPVENSVISPKDLFFNIDNCKDKYAYLLEGSFDVMRMGDNFLCSGGIELTETQLHVLSRFEKIGIMFDSEKEAQSKAKKFAKSLVCLGLEVEIIDAFYDYGCKDAGELTNEQAENLRKQLL